MTSKVDAAKTRALLGRMWREDIAHRRGQIALVLGLTAIMAATTALYPVMIDHAFDRFTAKDSRILYQLPGLVVLVTGIKAASQYFQNVEVQRIVLQVIRALQERMFLRLLDTDLARVEREAPARIAQRFTTDATVIRESLTRAVNGIADVVTVIGLVASMLYLDWVLSAIAALLYPLAALPIERIGRRIRRASGGMQEQMGAAATLLNESFAQARTVRAYRLEAAEAARGAAMFGGLYRALLKMSRSRARIDPVLEVLGGAAVAAVIGFAGWRSAHGGANTIGNFTGFVAALLIAARPLRALGSLNAAIQEGLAGLERVYAVVDERPGVVEAPDARALPPGPGEVRFDAAAFAYPDGRAGLRGVSFTAAPGTTVALVGASGAGKSTALALIPRFYDVAAGAVSVDGVDVRRLMLASLRDAIAYVGQDSLLFDDTIAANIRMGRPAATDAEVIEAAAAAAGGFIAALPDGFATLVGPGGQRLSGGQRQRVALARAFLRDPRILLLDEATSALDTESEAAVQAALTRLRRGRTTLIVAHRLSTVRDADLVVVLEDGRVVEAGPHASLLAADGAFARLVRGQILEPSP